MKKQSEKKHLQTDELAIQQSSAPQSIIKQMSQEEPINDIIELASKLMQIESTSSKIEGLHEAISIVGETLKDFTIEPYKHNNIPSLLVHNAAPGTKDFYTILHCHVDVVPGNENQFDPYIENGKFHGRGSYDMKAATAVMITVFNHIASKVSLPIALLIVADEEVGGYDGMAKHVEDGLRAKFAITGESGSNLRIINKAKGMLRLKLIANGKSSHSAYPWLGENAILKINDTIYHLLEKYPMPKKEEHHTTFNVTNISTKKEDIHTVTPDYCEAIVDVRFIPDDEKNLYKNIDASLDEGVSYEVIFHSPAVNTKQNDPYVKKLDKAVQEVLQKKTTFASVHATSDLRHLVPHNIPCVEFGPIGGSQHHDHEWVDVQSLKDYYQILKTFLLSLN